MDTTIPRHPVPTGMRLPDTSHLTPEDAALLQDLYVERNTVSRGEAARARHDAQATPGATHPFVRSSVRSFAA